jgi:transcriptional regulator with XRE-family HTH domain
VLAERAAMDWSYVAQVERGERNIALINILRLAETLELDAGDLFRGLTLRSR